MKMWWGDRAFVFVGLGMLWWWSPLPMWWFGALAVSCWLLSALHGFLKWQLGIVWKGQGRHIEKAVLELRDTDRSDE